LDGTTGSLTWQDPKSCASSMRRGDAWGHTRPVCSGPVFRPPSDGTHKLIYALIYYLVSTFS